MKRILLLAFNNENDDNCLLKAIDNNKQIDAVSALRQQDSLFIKGLRRLSFKYNIGIGFWLGKWKYNINQYDLCICIASKYSTNILKWISKKNEDVRLINYYWDKIEVLKYPIKKDLMYESWSFDKENSIEYDMYFNPQFYADDLKLPNQKIKYDISFVAADRGGEWKERTKLVKDIHSQLIDTHLNLFFYYVCSDTFNRTDYMYDKKMSETNFLKVVSSSKAILDIVDPQHSWNTLRPLLALTNGKKLITNNSGVKKEKYYNKENIFIIGEEDIRKIGEFISSPFVPLSEEVKKYYEVSSWMNRFLNH